MDNRKWLASADAAPPPVPAVPSTGYPRDTTPPTVPGAWWYHSVGEELRAVLAQAGLSPDINSTTQLRDAILAIASANATPILLTAQVFVAGVANGNAVRWDASVNKWAKAVADGTANDLACSFADVTNAKVYLAGLAPGLFAGLTPGARYFLDAATPGAITTVAPADAIYVGIAKSATDLFVDFDPAKGVAVIGGLTGAAIMPGGTTAQRPGAPSVYATRFNTTLAIWEFWDGAAWSPVGGSQVIRGTVRRTTHNTQAISASVETQFAPGGGWTTSFDSTPTSVSGNTLVVPAGLGITRGIVTGACPLNASVSGAAVNIRKNGVKIGAGMGNPGGSSGMNVTCLIDCGAGDVFDLSVYDVSGTTANSAGFYGDAFLSAIWL